MVASLADFAGLPCYWRAVLARSARSPLRSWLCWSNAPDSTLAVPGRPACRLWVGSRCVARGRGADRRGWVVWLGSGRPGRATQRWVQWRELWRGGCPIGCRSGRLDRWPSWHHGGRRRRFGSGWDVCRASGRWWHRRVGWGVGQGVRWLCWRARRHARQVRREGRRVHVRPVGLRRLRQGPEGRERPRLRLQAIRQAQG